MSGPGTIRFYLGSTFGIIVLFGMWFIPLPV